MRFRGGEAFRQLLCGDDGQGGWWRVGRLDDRHRKDEKGNGTHRSAPFDDDLHAGKLREPFRLEVQSAPLVRAERPEELQDDDDPARAKNALPGAAQFAVDHEKVRKLD